MQFVSPQVWASRPGRAKLLESDYDLLLSIFPFEKEWYAQRVPKLRVEFRRPSDVGSNHSPRSTVRQSTVHSPGSVVLLLPGSRKSELKHHLPAMLGALKLIREKLPSAIAKMVLPNEEMKTARVMRGAWPGDTGRKFAGGIGERRFGHNQDRYGDHGMRVFWRACGDDVQKTVTGPGHCSGHCYRKIIDHAEPHGWRGSVSGVHPVRCHGAKHSAAQRWICCKMNRGGRK